MVVKYKFGNLLRGFIVYHAKNDVEAWAIGCAIFNHLLPSRGGRTVSMYCLKKALLIGNPIASIRTVKKKEVVTYDDGQMWFPVAHGVSNVSHPDLKEPIHVDVEKVEWSTY